MPAQAPAVPRTTDQAHNEADYVDGFRLRDDEARADALAAYELVQRETEEVLASIDGATMYPSLAAAEGWPATNWLQPWTPSR